MCHASLCAKLAGRRINMARVTFCRTELTAQFLFVSVPTARRVVNKLNLAQIQLSQWQPEAAGL